jgi:hypothetical protein
MRRDSRFGEISTMLCVYSSHPSQPNPDGFGLILFALTRTTGLNESSEADDSAWAVAAIIEFLKYMCEGEAATRVWEEVFKSD